MFGWLKFILGYLWLLIVYLFKFILYVILTFLFILWKHQGSILYQRHAPSRKRQIYYNPFPRYKTPLYYKINNYQDIFIKTYDDVNIHCIIMKQKNNSIDLPTFIMFHGNAGNIGYRLPNAVQMYHELNINVILVDYRGYGNSEGIPTQKGLIYDAEAVLSYIIDEINDINPNKIYLFGRSLGGAVAIELAYRCCTRKLDTIKNQRKYVKLNDERKMVTKISSIDGSKQEIEQTLINNNDNVSDSISDINETESMNNKRKSIKICGLIVENTFTCLLDMVLCIINDFITSQWGNPNYIPDENDNIVLNDKNDYGMHPIFKSKKFYYFKVFLSYFISNKWLSINKIKDITIPILFLSGLQDELVPPHHMKQLNEKATNSVLNVMQTYPDGDHNSTWQRGGPKYMDDLLAFLTSSLDIQSN
mmetsp:Transcript_34196/g.42104  ORF Transcript_34196/g.42104 Transcript_34196/m.42104 type:complete len:419 (-) Transcript_34196:28-1284(-)